MGDVMPEPLNSSNNTGAHLASLETRVSGLEDGVKNILSQIQSLAVEFRDRGKTPWNIIWSAVGVSFAVIVAIGGLAYAPIIATQARMEMDARAHYQELRNDIQRVDRDTPNRNEYERGRSTNDRNLERLEKRIDRLEYDRKPN